MVYSGKLSFYGGGKLRLMALMHHSGSIAIVMVEVLCLASETSPVEGLYVDVKLRKQKWLISCSYNPNIKSMISQHMEALGKIMDLYSSAYENYIFLADFNAGMEHSALNDLIPTNRPKFL